MTQEEKELLLKDLCARLPYGVFVKAIYDKPITREMGLGTLHDFMFDNISDVKPYLRPLSSMTDEEYEHYNDLPFTTIEDVANAVFWYYEHHFDVYGLIEKGLAIEVTEENNPYMPI